MGLFNGKIAIVIGGSRGIGAGVSRRLAADGAGVAIIYLSRSDEAEAFEDTFRDAGASILTVQADASDPSALINAIDDAVVHFGRIDILACVAGIAITGLLGSYADDAFDHTFALNVKMPFVAAKKVAEVMESGGRIITIGSIVADRMPGSGGALYAASKAALGGLTRGLARDLGERNITVNLVQPGPIDTERNPADGRDADANRSTLALARHGTADEVASLVCYLASPDAGFITGATYNIDGGWSA